MRNGINLQDPRTLNILWAFLCAVCMFVVSAIQPPADTNKYFTITGPEYQEVSRLVFYTYRNEGGCVRLEVKSYPGFIEAHCYL